MRETLNSSNYKGHEDHEGKSRKPFVAFVLRLFSTENIWAFALFLIAVALIIFTSDSSPVWIYQGF